MTGRIRGLVIAPLVGALMVGMIAFAGPAAATGGAIISNGTVMLGVHNEGHLNVCCGPASSGEGTSVVGLRYLPTGAEATAPGCLCEGWGAADATSGVTGYANQSSDGGARNLTNISFTATADTAVSVVRIGSTLEVTHDYHPSVDPNLYEATVTIRNISESLVSPRYRRVMDWDIEPTAFDEFVTIIPGSSTALLYDSNDGFQSANPLAPRRDLGFTGEFIDQGPDDHGAMFDFGFPDLAPGAERTFKIYYGAAATERAALTSIVKVRAETFSLGQPSTPDGPRLGTPNTFIFAFAGVGGQVFCAGVPAAPSSLPASAKALTDRLFCDTLAALQLDLPLPELPSIAGTSTAGTGLVGVRKAVTPNPANRKAVTKPKPKPKPVPRVSRPVAARSEAAAASAPTAAAAAPRANVAAVAPKPSVTAARPVIRVVPPRIEDLGMSAIFTWNPSL